MLRPTITLALVALAAVACSSGAAAGLDAFDVPAFDFQQLTAASSQASAQAILQALQADGIIALKNVPQYEQLRAAYLLEATQCALAAGRAGDAFLQHKTLSDDTQRFTISATAGKELGAAAGETRARCPEYAAKYQAFSLLVEGAVQALGKTLDATPFTISSHESLTGSELMGDSVHLDHFHAYEAAPSASSSAAINDDTLSLDLHTDNGMLIAMTAPKYFDVLASTEVQQRETTTSASYESGLLIENRFGKLVRPVLKEDELVLMVGSGFQEWVRTSPSLRPVPHAMKYPSVSASGERLIRAWFGKMVLLSHETRMLNVDMTFGKFAARTARYLMNADEHDAGFAALACPRGRRLHESDKACVKRTCFPKPGKDPALACSIQCNTSNKSRPGADRLCEENCVCEETPAGNATSAQYCWTLCVDLLPESQCAITDQVCKSGNDAPYILDQQTVCNPAKNASTTSAINSNSDSTVTAAEAAAAAAMPSTAASTASTSSATSLVARASVVSVALLLVLQLALF